MSSLLFFSFLGGFAPSKILVLPFDVSPDLPKEAGVGLVLGLYDHLYDYQALVPVADYISNLEKHGVFNGTTYPRAKLQSVFPQKVDLRIWGSVQRAGTEIWVEDLQQGEVSTLFLQIPPEDPQLINQILGLVGFETQQGQSLSYYTKLAAPLFVQDPSFSGQMFNSLVREHQGSSFVFWIFDQYAPELDPNQLDAAEASFWRDYFILHKDFFAAYQLSDVILQRNVSGQDYAQHAKILSFFKQWDEAERYNRMAKAYGFKFPTEISPSSSKAAVK